MNWESYALLAVLIVVARLTWRRGGRAVAVGCTAAAVMLAAAILRQTPTWVLVLLGVVLVLLGWQYAARTSGIVMRWGARSRRKSGVASTADILRSAGTLAMRRRAGVVRPSLHVPSRWGRLVQRLRLPAQQVAVQVCLVGFLYLWVSVEDFLVIIGGPRTGKTQLLAGQVIDAPGAVLVTSTRTDLLDQTGPLRAAMGPVYVFNPVGLGARPSTITFDPLTGCGDPVTAHERAADMLAASHPRGSGGGDREFWDDLARRNLAALLHAAALGGLTIDHISDWLVDLDGNATRIVGLLRDKSPEPAFEAAAAQFIGTNDKTRTSITSTMSAAFGWNTHGPARAAALPVAAGGHAFDVAELLDGRAAVYLLGGEEAQVAPLVCALTGYIAREARRLAASRPGGRLDPPLSLRLDECALICPVPLHKWSADMGGRGVSIVASFQSRAQIVSCYGTDDAAVILNNSAGRALFGGTADRDDLQFWSTLAGERDEPITTTDLHGRVASRTVRRVPVLTPAQLANLPAGRVVLFRRDMPPVIGKAPRAWRRRDVVTVHQPDALAVRARAGMASGRTASAAWLARCWAPVGARLARPARWVADRFAVVTGGVRRVLSRVTGRGAASGYRAFGQPVDPPTLPHLHLVHPDPGVWRPTYEDDRPPGSA